MVIKLPTFRLTPEAILPTRGTPDAAGLDLYASQGVVIHPQNRVLVATGIAAAIPVGYYGRVAPRSGLAVKHGINVLAGVIDCDYRGEIKVLLHNTQNFGDFHIRPGDRIAQLIIEEILMPDVEEVASLEELGTTGRGDKGYGSTGR